jgi:glucose/arabinose dehydrogenase
MAWISQFFSLVVRLLTLGVPVPALRAVLSLLAVVLAACGAFRPASAIQLPAGFTIETLPWTFDVPTRIAFLPDGRLLVAEKGGIVYVVSGNVRHPLWVREDEVLNTDDRGLLAIAVDPAFVTNRRLYFLYNCDPDSNGVELDNYDESFGRLTRYELSATDSNAVDEGTRTILIGATWAEGIPSASGAHNVADLEWGRDGTLLVSAGDGAHFEEVDAGGMDPNQFLPGRTDPAQDLGAFRSQWIGSMNGKVLRIDPATGHGLPSNPFWNGNPAAPQSRVWAYGFRNPFRIAVRPGTGDPDPAAGNPGQIFVGDVGWLEPEEINVLSQGGGNYGWPCFEGFAQQVGYQAATPSSCDCTTLGTPVNPSLASPPVVSVARFDGSLSVPPGRVGGTIVGGAFYTGTQYPSPYRGLYFFGDYLESWIDALDTRPDGSAPHRVRFAEDAEGPVSFATDPFTGDLWYVSIWTGQVRRIRWTGTTEVEPRPVAASALSAALPNPTRGGVTMSLDLARPARLELHVHDASGRRVWQDVTRDLPAGRQVLTWSGRDASGVPVAPGLYLISVEASGTKVTRRVVVLR